MISDSFMYSAFDTWVEKTPSAIAISTSNLKITYKHLGDCVNHLAFYLQKLGVEPNQLIAIIMPKSWYQVVAVLSIQKAGAAYLPININDPPNRQLQLIREGKVKIVLTIEKCRAHIADDSTVLILSIDEFLSKNNFKREPLLVRAKPQDLAYVVFTSGSTGVPKGVMISHENALNTINDINDRFNITNKDSVLALSALDFDLSVYDIFGMLSSGGTIVLPDQDKVRDPGHWLAILTSGSVTIWNSVPAFMDMMVKYVKYKKGSNYKLLNSTLRLVLLSGDWIPLGLPTQIGDIFNYAKVVSLGGATEGSIWSILYEIKDIDPAWSSIPYGKAMLNQKFYILDENLESVNINQVGELYIGGAGVAQGYWNNIKKTQEQFITHPRYGRLYKTGDLGKFDFDENIIFLGRVDNQVKIRGFRIELGAISKIIESSEYVKKALVLDVKGEEGAHHLVAYVSLSDDFSRDMESSFRGSQVDYWKEIYNYTFLSKKGEKDLFNTSGWVSSYSKQEYPICQMKEWVNDTVASIKKYKPNTVLEVGCGTGLILFRLIEDVQQYDAIDISKSAVDFVKEHVRNTPYYEKVECRVCEAIDIKRENFYDTVILNSVSQYCPSIEYLSDTLEKIIASVKEGGVVFIGDVYNLEYINDFHLSVLLHKVSEDSSLLGLLQASKILASEDNHLSIHPEYFYNLTQVFDRITHVEVKMKHGKFRNEMNSFRYDVTIHIESSVKAKANSENIVYLSSTDNICSYLNKDKNEVIVIKNLVNRRMVEFLAVNKGLESKKSLKNIKSSMLELYDEAKDPHDIYQLGIQNGYKVDCIWGEEKYHFSVAFYTKSSPFLHARDEKLQNSSVLDYSNFPYLARNKKHIRSYIFQHVQKNISEHMVPKKIYFLDEFPTTRNGKLDTKLLGEISLLISSLVNESGVQAKPKNEIESKLCKIFSQKLNLKCVGTGDDFFLLGGDSFLMLEIVHQIDKTFGINFALQNFIINPTITNLANHIAELVQV